MKKIMPSMSAAMVFVFLSHVVVASSLVQTAPAVVPASEALNGQLVEAVEWAQQASAAAQTSAAVAQKVKEDVAKAGTSIVKVLAETGAAKAAMDGAIQNEKMISQLRDQAWQEAKQTALAEIPKILPELKKKSEMKANEEAKKRAETFRAKMQTKGRIESAKASKVYTDVMDGAGKSAADYTKAADGLVANAASMQMDAHLAQGQANQYIRIGDMGEAQKLMQQSRMNMNAAMGFNSQASEMYDTAGKITATLPVYASQAAAAAAHAQALYDPEAPSVPAQPLVLAQHDQRHNLLSRALRAPRK